MNYVEWLRVRNVLKVTAIILGIFLVLTLVFRVAAMRFDTTGNWLQHIQTEPGTKVTHTILADGTPRTIWDTPDGSHVVLDDHGYAGKRIVVTEPKKSRHHDNPDHVAIGSLRIDESATGDTTTTTIDTGQPASLLVYVGVAALIGFIIATIFGSALARENDGHLEIAMTKPVSRVRYVLGVYLADICGILAAQVITIVAILLAQAMFEVPRIDFSGVAVLGFWMIVGPGAWYMMLAAATASLRRNYGAVQGFAWPVAIVISLVALIPAGDTLLGQTIHAIFYTISRIDPLSYSTLSAGGVTVSEGMPVVQGLTLATRSFIEAGLMIGYGILALIQWQRVEA